MIEENDGTKKRINIISAIKSVEKIKQIRENPVNKDIYK